MPIYQFNFRSTAGFVTDGAGATYVRSVDTYPTTRGGVTFGWTDAGGGWPDDRDRDAGIDVRLAGTNLVNGVIRNFRVDLPGDNKIRLALGDAGGDRNEDCDVRDSAGSKFVAVSGGATGGGGGQFYDATGVKRTSPADWVTNNAQSAQYTFADYVLIRLGDGVNQESIAHLEIEAAIAGDTTRPTVTAAGVLNSARTKIGFFTDETASLPLASATTSTVTIKENGTPRSINVTSISGGMFFCENISPAIVKDCTLTASFVSASNPLADSSGNKVNDFTDLAILNPRWRYFHGTWPLPIKAAAPYDVDLAHLWLVAQAAGKKKCYLSITGSDAANGLTSATAKQTIAAINGIRGDGDWVVVKSGDTFDEANNVMPANSTSAATPSVLTVYGGTARAVFTADTTILSRNATLTNVIVDSLEAYNKRADPTNGAYVGTASADFMVIDAVGSNLMLQNCKWRYCRGASIDNASGQIENITVRRCMAQLSWSGNSHSSGLFVAGYKGLRIEHSVFDHNGWNLTGVNNGQATIFNHNFYLSSAGFGGEDLSFVGNLSTRASSHGCQARPGGTVFGNIFIDNALAMFNGGAAGDDTHINTAYTVANIAIGGRDIDGAPRTIQIESLANPHGYFVDNIVKDWTGSATNAEAFGLGGSLAASASPKVFNLTVTGNISYNFNGIGLLINTNEISSMDIKGNDFSVAAGRQSAQYTAPNPVNNSYFRFASNNYHNDGGGFTAIYNGATVTVLATYEAAVGETGGTNTAVSYSAPTRTHLTYNSDATLDAFVTAAMAFDAGTANATYYNYKISNHIRAGFGLAAINTYLSEPLTLAISSSGGHPKLDWTDDNSYRTGWRIYRSADGVNFSAVTTVADGTNTYTDSAVSGTSYLYRIAPYDGTGEGPWLQARAIGSTNSRRHSIGMGIGI